MKTPCALSGTAIMQKPNSITVLLYILILRNRGEAFSHSVSEENTSRGLVTRQISAANMYALSQT